MGTMVELIAEYNKIKTENEKLKNACLEYEVYKEAMAICCKEKNELISKYRNYKAEIMQKVKTMENELARNTEVIQQLTNEVKLIKIENTNLKEELAQQKSNKLEYNALDYITTGNEASYTVNVSELENSYLDITEKENSQKTGQTKVINNGRRRRNCKFGGQIKTINSKHQDSSYVCGICNKVLKTEHTIKNHISRMHTEKKKLYKCEFCSQELISRFNYRRHVYFRHQEIDNSKVRNIKEAFEKNAKYSLYTCSICRCDIKSFYNYQRHLLSQHNKMKKVKVESLIKRLNPKIMFRSLDTTGCSSYSCDICKKVFTNKSGIRSHITAVHSEERYKCNICSKEIKTISNYRTHLHKFHNQE